MAVNQNSVIITNLEATGYNANVEATQSGYVITGQVSCNGQKLIISFNGQVDKDNERICSFNSYQYAPPTEEQSGLSYNITDIRDITKAAGAIVAIGAAETAIQAELLGENE